MSKELKAYLVDDTEFIAAYNEQQAKDIHREMTGEKPESIKIADLSTGWRDENEEIHGTLGDFMGQVTEPKWIGSTEY